VSASWIPWTGEHPVQARLEWTNTSATADTHQVVRDGKPVTSVPAPAATADDSPPWPSWPI